MRHTNPLAQACLPKSSLESTGSHSVKLCPRNLISAPGRFQWTLGAFYFHHRYGYDPAILAGPALGGGPTGSVIAPSFGRVHSYAAYGQGTLNLNEKLRLTLGLRFTHDEVKAGGRADFALDDVIVAPTDLGEAKNKFDKMTWRGVLDYKPVEDVLIYGSVSRGYKAGIFNIITFDPTPVQPETLDAYEIGVKTKFLGGRARLNAAAFYYDQKDPQVFVVPRPGTNALINAGGARVKGFEADGEIFVTPRFRLRGGATFIDAEYTDFANAPFYSANPNPPYGNLAPSVGSANGNALGRAPKFSGNVGASYELAVGADTLRFGANYTYVGKFYWEPDLRTTGGKYGLLDANIAYSFAGDAVSLTLWASNLTKEKYYVAEYEQAGQPGFAAAPGEPRRYGARLRYNF
ncbi:MAG: TonB-dependent receptor [Sphingobium sp.]